MFGLGLPELLILGAVSLIMVGLIAGVVVLCVTLTRRRAPDSPSRRAVHAPGTDLDNDRL